MRTIHHMSASIEGLLDAYKNEKITFLEDDKGNKMTDYAAREELKRLKALGHKLIPSDLCKGFDPFGKGCPSHPIFITHVSVKIYNYREKGTSEYERIKIKGRAKTPDEAVSLFKQQNIEGYTGYVIGVVYEDMSENDSCCDKGLTDISF